MLPLPGHASKVVLTGLVDWCVRYGGYTHFPGAATIFIATFTPPGRMAALDLKTVLLAQRNKTVPYREKKSVKHCVLQRLTND